MWPQPFKEYVDSLCWRRTGIRVSHFTDYRAFLQNLNHANNNQSFGLLAFMPATTLQWRHNEQYGVSNHQPHDCLLNRLFKRRSKKTSKPRVTGLCEGNSLETGEFPAQRVSNAENVSIWWRHHVQGTHRVPAQTTIIIYYVKMLQWRYSYLAVLNVYNLI